MCLSILYLACDRVEYLLRACRVSARLVSLRMRREEHPQVVKPALRWGKY